jgi:hypothetical protein
MTTDPLAVCQCSTSHVETVNMRLELDARGGHTSAFVGRCSACSGLFGFPPPNLQLALDSGYEPTLTKLAKIGVKRSLSRQTKLNLLLGLIGFLGGVVGGIVAQTLWLSHGLQELCR